RLPETTAPGWRRTKAVQTLPAGARLELTATAKERVVTGATRSLPRHRLHGGVLAARERVRLAETTAPHGRRSKSGHPLPRGRPNGRDAKLTATARELRWAPTKDQRYPDRAGGRHAWLGR